MSYVTNVILTFSSLEETGESESIPPVDKVNEWLADHGQGQFARVDQRAGGKKVMEARVFLLAANYLDEPAFIEAVQAAGWEEPDMVRIFLQAQEEDVFRMVEVAHM